MFRFSRMGLAGLIVAAGVGLMGCQSDGGADSAGKGNGSAGLDKGCDSCQVTTVGYPTAPNVGGSKSYILENHAERTVMTCPGCTDAQGKPAIAAADGGTCPSCDGNTEACATQ